MIMQKMVEEESFRTQNIFPNPAHSMGKQEASTYGTSTIVDAQCGFYTNVIVRDETTTTY